MPDIALDKASFISLWVETLLYGTYAVLFAICVHVLLYSRRGPGGQGSSFNWPLLTTAVAMFTMSSMHIVIGLVRGLTAFIDRNDIPDGAILYYAEIWTWINIFKQALYATNNIVADGLIYRCYIVWGSRYKIIVVPCIMLLAISICAYGAVYNFSIMKPGQDVFASNVAEWGTALFSLSLATNIIVTCLIAGRIWWLAKTTNKLLGSEHSDKYQNAIAIIIESGAIYSISLMTLLILYCSETNAQYIVYVAHAQITGIVPTLIIARVGLGVSTEDNTTVGLHTTAASNNNTRVPYNRSAVRMYVQRMVAEETVDSGMEMDDAESSRKKHANLYHSNGFGNHDV
ncbi:hypothetical protein C8J57DRAFT_1518008 [Mycena rebaudengoi]|nr:hypothetical protein C8J57DRAFT_1518008 [Mycena rebaudengoi]